VAQSWLYRNAVHAAHWLHLDLQGRNRDALGAKLELVANGLHQYREFVSTYGYCSQMRPGAHFGLGPATQVDTLRILWPNGGETVQTDIATGQRLRMVQPELPTALLATESAPPAVFQLRQNYPNPFNVQTIITYQLPRPVPAQLTVYNITGQPVKHLVDKVQPAGQYRISWNGTDDTGQIVASGVYLYRLKAGAYEETLKLLLLQ